MSKWSIKAKMIMIRNLKSKYNPTHICVSQIKAWKPKSLSNFAFINLVHQEIITFDLWLEGKK